MSIHDIILQLALKLAFAALCIVAFIQFMDGTL
jgi:hypothetical protein